MTAPVFTRRTWIICLVLALGTFAIYWPVHNYSFVEFDDQIYVYENTYIARGLTFDALKWAFTSGYGGNWHPLTWISHMLDIQFFGLNAGAHHSINVLFHAASSVLLFLVLRRMTRAEWPCAIVAALFAWHPLHVESVAWVAERKDVLSTFFWMMTLWTYASYVETRQRKQLYLTLLWFAFGLMAKPMLVTLPFVLVLLDVWPLRRIATGPAPAKAAAPNQPQGGAKPAKVKKGKTTPTPAALVAPSLSLGGSLREKLPFFALTVFCSIVTFLVQRKAGAVMSVSGFPLWDRVTNAVVAYAHYLGQMIWPANLAVIYPHPGHWPAGTVAIAFVSVIIITAIVLKFAVRHPYLLVGWLWYLGTLVPVIGLVQVGTQSAADRYTYVPLIGVFIMVVWAVAELTARWRARDMALAVACVALLAACAATARYQVQFWRENFALYGRALAVTQNNSVAERGMGLAYARAGKPDEALKHFMAAVRANTKFPAAHYSLGGALERKGDWNGALAEYNETLRMTPDVAAPRLSRAKLFLNLGRMDEALADSREVVRQHPDNAEVHDTLGAILEKMGKNDEAVVEFREALRLDPNRQEAHYNLGVVLASQGKIMEAIDQYREAVRLKPTSPGAHNNLAVLLLSQGLVEEGVVHYGEALRYQPNSPETRYNLSLALASQGKSAEVVKQLREAVRLKPDWPLPIERLAWVLATAKDPAVRNGNEAVTLADRACAMTGRTDARSLATLAAAYAETGKFTEAISTAQTAIELATRAGQTELATAIQKPLAAYQANRPYRE